MPEKPKKLSPTERQLLDPDSLDRAVLRYLGGNVTSGEIGDRRRRVLLLPALDERPLPAILDEFVLDDVLSKREGSLPLTSPDAS